MTVLASLQAFHQESVRADGLFYDLLGLRGRVSGRDGNQPVPVVVVLLPVRRVDPVLQDHLILLAVLIRDEGFGELGGVGDERGRVHPPAKLLARSRLRKGNTT